ncbi:MAG TPA: sporulation protein [Planctomycetaceae bacterium]|nr:sporulation protein [Planctomycetaceae bacterium]
MPIRLFTPTVHRSEEDMGFFDKIKSMVNVVTGGAATVTIDYPQQLLYPGDQVPVKITATSTGQEVKSKGAFVDVLSFEKVKFKHDKEEIDQSHTFVQQAFQIAPAFVLQPNETKVFEGQFQLPLSVLPTYSGKIAQHKCQIRGRIEAFGNDPDSGYIDIAVGSKQ